MKSNTVVELYASARLGDGCWEWKKARNVGGYGFFWYKNKQMMAHRVSWFMTMGAIPTGLLVLHKCDNPCCVRPTHLFLGTYKDNSEDRDRKGRGATGIKNPKSKLNPELVDDIRKRFNHGEQIKSIANSLSLSHGCISHVVHKRTWVRP